MSAIIRRRPFPARTISKQEFLTPFDRIFDDMLGNMFPTFAADLGDDFFAKGSFPKVNVINRDHNILIEAAIPGMSRDDIEVEMTDKILTIQGGSKQRTDVEDSQYVKREIKRSAFRRSFTLNDNLDSDNISATFDNGILSLNIPKIVPDTVRTETRKIQIG